ncbi:N-formylglutamate amidohydrolase [Roseovarius salinarum]|uniref:N-formylglutamate amidohydrolase n=1 Tax=Roseovarius salinarum TaxID=1981892 RepID=UPI000C31CDFD|nr:N-formylglutamate amidohydrolase [Roseovarius salinarum]
MPTRAYELIAPQTRTTSVVFASPHSGRDYPESFLRRIGLTRQAVRSSEDAYVDRLIEAAPLAGASLLNACAPRAFIDFNRGADELDPALIDGVRKIGHNPRVAAGLGVVPRVVANGQAIYRGKISKAEAQRRIDRYWHPYHATLRAELDAAHAAFGQAILVDFHSMPHEAMDSVAKSGGRRPDVVLGDRFGAAADAAVVDGIDAAFASAGLKVARNTLFAGAYITQTYGRPCGNRHAVQVEIDRSLYLDERNVAPGRNFAAFRALLEGVVAEIAAIGRPASLPLAAE